MPLYHDIDGSVSENWGYENTNYCSSPGRMHSLLSGDSPAETSDEELELPTCEDLRDVDDSTVCCESCYPESLDLHQCCSGSVGKRYDQVSAKKLSRKESTEDFERALQEAEDLDNWPSLKKQGVGGKKTSGRPKGKRKTTKWKKFNFKKGTWESKKQDPKVDSSLVCSSQKNLEASDAIDECASGKTENHSCSREDAKWYDECDGICPLFEDEDGFESELHMSWKQ